MLFRSLKGDRVYVMLNNDANIWADAYRNNMFSGFLYEPIHGISSGWSVAKTKNWSDSKNLSPIPFDDISVNDWGHWKEATSQYVCPYTGIYYITFTVAAQPFKSVDVSLMVNGNKRVSLVSSSTRHNGMIVMSRSVVLHLSIYDKVYLEARGGTAMYCSGERHTSFSGFFLYRN